MPVATETLRLLAVGGAVAGVATFWLLRRPVSRRGVVVALLAAVALSLLLREPFRRSFPATNDEGTILYDVQRALSSNEPWRLAGGAKGPLALLLLAPVVRGADDPLAAARLLVSGLAALEAVLLGLLAWRLWGERAGVLAALLYAVTPAVLAQTTHVFLQPFALPFATAGLVLLARPPARRRVLLALGAGALLGLAFLARFTALAFLPLGMLLALTWGAVQWPIRLRHAVLVVGGFTIVIGLVSLFLWPRLGREKTLDVLGAQGIVVGQQRAGHGQSTPGLNVLRTAVANFQLPAALKLMSAALRGALPVLVLAAAWLLIAVADLLALPRAVPAVGLLVLAMLLASVLTPADLTPQLLAARAPLVGGAQLLTALAGAATFFSARAARRAVTRDLLFFGVGLLLFAVGYANFGRFRQHYHAEFLVFYALAAAAFLAQLLAARPPARWAATLTRSGVFLLTGGLLGLSLPVARAHPHVGNLPLDVVRTVAEDLRQRVPPGEEVFTAQVLFPAVARRGVPYDIAHPGWYREEALGGIPPALRARYYPDRDTLRRSLDERPVRVAVIERRTRETFLEFDSSLQDLLTAKYELVRTIENPLLEPVEIWERRGSDRP